MPQIQLMHGLSMSYIGALLYQRDYGRNEALEPFVNAADRTFQLFHDQIIAPNSQNPAPLKDVGPLTAFSIASATADDIATWDQRLRINPLFQVHLEQSLRLTSQRAHALDQHNKMWFPGATPPTYTLHCENYPWIEKALALAPALFTSISRDIH